MVEKAMFFSDSGKAIFLKSHALTHFCSENGIVCKNTRSIASLKVLSGPSLGGAQAPSAHCWAVGLNELLRGLWCEGGSSSQSMWGIFHAGFDWRKQDCEVDEQL